MPEEPTIPDIAEIGREIIEAESYEQWAALAGRFYDSDIVWDLGGMLGSIEGLTAVLALVKDWWSMWEDHHHYVAEAVDLGHGVGYAVVREDGRMKGGHGRIQATNAWVSLWVKGRIMRSMTFSDIDRGRSVAERLAQDRRGVSEPNVELARAAYSSLDRGDVAAFLDVLDPDVEWWTRADNPDTSVIRGHEGVKVFLAETLDVLEEFRIEPTEIVDAGEYLVVSVRQLARTRGALIEQHEVHVGRLRGGKIIEIREFHEKPEALKAVGLI